MTKKRAWLRGIPVLLILVLLALPAAGQQLALLRVESLDGAFGDMEALAAAVGADFKRGDVLGPALSEFGISDSSILDFKRPLVMVLPMEGMMMQQKGLVAALPVAEAGPVLEALAGNFAAHEELEGLHTYSTEAGPALYALSRDGYLIAGGTRELVQKFDLSVGLDRGDGPPGNLMMDIYLEPVAPMLQMGLMSGKQQIINTLEQAGGDPESPIQPSDMRGFIDLYATLIQNVLNNVSRIQFSLQLDGSHALVHKRLVPKAGSTLAELVGAQKGGFPKVAGFVDPKATMVGSSSLALTPAFRSALKTFVGEYISAVRPIVHRMGPAFLGELPEGSDPKAELDELVGKIRTSMEQAIDCFRGDGAASFDFAAQGGIDMVEAFGWETTEACRKYPQEQMKLWGEVLARFPRVGEFVSYSDGGTVGGASTYVVNMDMKSLFEAMGQADAEMAEMTELIEKIYGDGFSVRTAYLDDLVVAVAGAEAEAGLQSLLAKRGQAGLKGLTAAEFAPLGRGTGLFFRFDVGRLLESAKAWIPKEERNDEDFARVVTAFSGPAGRIPMGMVFDSGGATGQIAVPMATLEAIGKMVAEEKAEHEHAPETGE